MTMTGSWMLKGLLVLLAMAGLGVAEVRAQTVEYVHTDALGSVVAITDAAGTVIERNEYEPYGNDLTGAKDGPGYTGHVSDAATGLSYMQQRYYDPSIGRFLSVDPVTADGNPGGNFNRYWYANNNPYKFTDPDGRQSKAAGKQLGRVIRAAWESGGDPKKFDAKMEEYRAQDRAAAGAIVEMTSVAIVKDAVEVTAKVMNDKDATAQGAGAVAGEVAGQVTEKVLDGKIGDGGASVAGAVVGKAVSETVQSMVGADSSSVGQTTPAEPPRPSPRAYVDKVGDK